MVPAYALTIHRSQGISLQQVAIDFGTISTWIPSGMAYVALSRCTRMEGLWVRRLKRTHIVVNEYAAQIMQDIDKLKRQFVRRVIGNCITSKIGQNHENRDKNEPKKRPCGNETEESSKEIVRRPFKHPKIRDSELVK